MSKQKSPIMAPDQAESWLRENWVGETHDPKTNQLTARMTIKSGQPFMVTYNDRGEPNGFGIV